MKAARTLYLILVNAIALLVLAIFGLHAVAVFVLHVAEPSRYEHLPAAAKQAYDHMAPADVDALLRSIQERSFVYEPWVGWREASQSSKFLNIDEDGIRSNGRRGRGIERLNGAIWLYGGSTTFGERVADEETIPAQLERILGRPVVNLGRAAFFSAQENLLLARHLQAGYRPRLVLFLDGINEVCDVEMYQPEMQKLFALAQRPGDWGVHDFARPLFEVLARLESGMRRMLGRSVAVQSRNELECRAYGSQFPLSRVHSRNLAERAALCQLHRVDCLTFVQPHAGMHGRYDGADRDAAFEHKLLRDKFVHLDAGWRAAGAIFVTDALDRHGAHAYVDVVHYSAAANRLIAEAVAGHLQGRLR